MNQKLVDFIKQVRKDRDWAQWQLAEEIGVDQSYVAQIELGKYEFPLQFFKELYSRVLYRREQKEFIKILHSDLIEILDQD